ncbi:HTH-type transcriptional repressor YvoA [Roseovarius albus]|uniref:HTH-type transcriptional repressor YvoA n=1 Tax=Roseovarius albus TaxID=1247867 RepID=A0A1X6Y5M0_9RHOB|nr:GntR family transcriptional regulator [Roseovarius albus]SLN11648.1 HTH-type transcriptional repressor YvoA [Roseovarius albus]
MTNTHALPVFRQIVDDLKRQIADGQLTEHAALPSERVIAELHAVSRMTARRALEAVEAEGLAYSKRRQGRFVSPKRLMYDVGSMANFVAGAAAQGIEIEMELLESTTIQASGTLVETLSAAHGTKLYQNTRLIRSKGHSIFVETETVIAERCAALWPGPDNVDLQRQRYSPLGHTAEIVIRMCALEPDPARLLGAMPYQAGIEQEQLSRDESGAPICFSHQIWRGEMAQFSATAIISR